MRPAGKCPGRSSLLFLHVQMSMSVTRRTGAAARSATTNQEASSVPAIAASHLSQITRPAKVRPWPCSYPSPDSLSWGRVMGRSVLWRGPVQHHGHDPLCLRERARMPIHTCAPKAPSSPQSLRTACVVTRPRPLQATAGNSRGDRPQYPCTPAMPPCSLYPTPKTTEADGTSPLCGHISIQSRSGGPEDAQKIISNVHVLTLY